MVKVASRRHSDHGRHGRMPVDMEGLSDVPPQNARIARDAVRVSS